MNSSFITLRLDCFLQEQSGLVSYLYLIACFKRTSRRHQHTQFLFVFRGGTTADCIKSETVNKVAIPLQEVWPG